MEIRTEPYTLKFDSNINVCPCCNSILQKEIKSGKYLIGSECGYCRYLDRPFGGCGNTASSHYGGCSCEYGEKDYLYISCKKCLFPKCIKCGDKCYCKGDDCNNIICRKCIKTTEFNNKWNTSTPQEKLNTYAIKKLQILAKNKKIKGFSKYKKNELINILIPLVSNEDFPIKPLY
jgi:hypothetical protein